MSYKYCYALDSTHCRNISCIGFNPLRREIFLGFEDGSIKVWEADPPKFVQNMSPVHQGWVTAFVYWSEIKTMISAGQDGVIMFWSGNSLVDVVHTEEPIYCMTLNHRKNQLVCGTSNGISLYELDKFKMKRHYINIHDGVLHNDHTDIVKCLAYYDSRVYSAGFDHTLIIYESGYHGVRPMTPLNINRHAHDTGIDNLIIAPDQEGNHWMVTAAFDKVVKIWTTEGKLVHRLDAFGNFITGICSAPRSYTIWLATGGHPHAMIIEPKSGETVSDFCATFLSTNKTENDDDLPYELQLLKSIPEQGLVLASTNRRQLICWKFAPAACITTFDTKVPLDCLAFTQKVPILIFSTDHNGEIVKWERRHTNQFAFSKESLKVSESMGKMLKKKLAHRRLAQLKKSPLQLEKEKHLKSDEKRMASSGKNYNKIQYIEQLDTLIAACDDSNTYIIGYDEKAFTALQHMVPLFGQLDNNGDDEMPSTNRTFGVESETYRDNTTDNNPVGMDDQVTKRVAGFKCIHVLVEHHSVVTCFVVITDFDDTGIIYLVTSGWDQRICIWNLFTGLLLDTYKDSDAKIWDERELAAPDAILDMAYNRQKNELATSCADSCVYIWKFSPRGHEMSMVGSLQGHSAEVNCVKWWNEKNWWITVSDDHCFCIWEGDGNRKCVVKINTGQSINCLELDVVSQAILLAVGNTLRVYDSENFDLVQLNEGHTDSVRSVVHIPDNKHFDPQAETYDIAEVYVTASWDGRICLWQAWRGYNDRKHTGIGKRNALGIILPPREPNKEESLITEEQWQNEIESKVSELKLRYLDNDLIHNHNFEHYIRKQNAKVPAST